jgi:hypothetical protein
VIINTRRIVSKKMRQYRRTSPIIEVIAGRADGTVYVPGTNKKKIYVHQGMNGESFSVWNKRSSPSKGDHLYIGEVDYEPGMVQVLDTPISPGAANTFSLMVVAHGDSHLITSTDPVYISTFQILECLVYAYSGMTIKINSGWVKIGAQLVRMEADEIDLTSYVPTGAAFDLIRVNENGVVSIQEGTPVASFVDLLWTDIPEIEDGYALLAVARLYEGQTILSRVFTNPDIIDARFAPSTAGGGGGSSDHKVMVSADDALAEYLEDKCLAGEGIEIVSIEDEEGIQQLRIVNTVTELDDLSDVNAPSPGESDTLVRRTGEWVNESGASISDDNADIDNVNLNELGVDPEPPGVGHRRIFARDDGIYEVNSDGDIVGPFNVGGGVAGKYRQFTYSVIDGDLTFLTDEDGNPLFIRCDLE